MKNTITNINKDLLFHVSMIKQLLGTFETIAMLSMYKKINTIGTLDLEICFKCSNQNNPSFFNALYKYPQSSYRSLKSVD